MAPAETRSTVVPVLWVSSHPDDLPALAKALKGQASPDFPDCRFEVMTANNVAGALLAVENARFPVVICERDLGKDTWKALLTGLGRQAQPPFLIVASRSADEFLWAEALNLGAYDVLARPFEPAEVMRTLNLAWLRWNGSERPRPAAA
jgi:DNA-binding response OmpR family regulator